MQVTRLILYFSTNNYFHGYKMLKTKKQKCHARQFLKRIQLPKCHIQSDEVLPEDDDMAVRTSVTEPMTLKAAFRTS